MNRLSNSIAVVILFTISASCAEQNDNISGLKRDISALYDVYGSEGVGCPPDCDRRRLSPDEMLAIEEQIDKMDSCSGIQQSLRDNLHNMRILTDDYYKGAWGGYWALYADQSTEIGVSQLLWDRLDSGVYNQNQFEAALFDVLKHEGSHDAAFDDGQFDPEPGLDSHNSYWNNTYSTCHAS